MYLKPVSEIKANLGIQPNGPVQAFFTDTCYKHMDKYVPMDTGDLRNIIDKGVDYITYESSYAEIQYYGIIWGHQIPKENYTTPRNRPILGQSYVECRRQKCNKGSSRICQWK